ncbi:winged helix-turn-helix domain-containing protein [Marinobacter sp.]|uniref:winged helix-turn-helix domain-containing protein n=1 Tax=Marinobacter sp. TaxID=50741 RepID=UPI0035C6D1A0
MNQIELIEDPVTSPAPESGGYAPTGKHIYRGRQVPATYADEHGMRRFRSPVLLWLMDLVIDQLRQGPMHWLEIAKVGWPVDSATLSRHLDLMRDVGLIESEPVYYGSRSPREGNYRGYQHRFYLADRQQEAA